MQCMRCGPIVRKAHCSKYSSSMSSGAIHTIISVRYTEQARNMVMINSRVPGPRPYGQPSSPLLLPL